MAAKSKRTVGRPSRSTFPGSKVTAVVVPGAGAHAGYRRQAGFYHPEEPSMATVNPYVYRLSDTPFLYPDSDGEPMAESDFQLRPLLYAINALRAFFAHRTDVYVAGNLFVYYEEGNPKSVVAPDVFAVFGVSRGDRSSYKIWEEGRAPDFVLEITSLATRAQDQGPKRGIYAYLGVREYFQADPTGDYLTPPLQGLQLTGDHYAPLPAAVRVGDEWRAYSKVLGLELRLNPARGELRFYDRAAERILPSYEEQTAMLQAEAQARQIAEQQAQAEAQARQIAERRTQAAEAELARLRAELARLQGTQE
jgi:Uma2 family endonuclease